MWRIFVRNTRLIPFHYFKDKKFFVAKKLKFLSFSSESFHLPTLKIEKVKVIIEEHVILTSIFRYTLIYKIVSFVSILRFFFFRRNKSGIHIVRLRMRHHLFLVFWLVGTWFFADWRHHRAVSRLENVRQPNIRWGEKLGFQLPHKHIL